MPRHVLIQDAEAIKSQIYHLGFGISSWFWYNPGKLQLPGHLLHEGHLQEKNTRSTNPLPKRNASAKYTPALHFCPHGANFDLKRLTSKSDLKFDENPEIMIDVRVATSLFQRQAIYHPPSINAITNQFQWSIVNSISWPYKHSLIYQSHINKTTSTNSFPPRHRPSPRSYKPGLCWYNQRLDKSWHANPVNTSRILYRNDSRNDPFDLRIHVSVQIRSVEEPNSICRSIHSISSLQSQPQ